MTRRVLIGLDPLRNSRGFRLLFSGQLIGVAGGQLAAVAVPYQVYLETRSALQIGLIGLSQLVPLILGALLGGSLGDVFDRRRILAVCSAALAVCSGALALNACAAHPPIAVLYLASAVSAGFGGALSAVCGAALPEPSASSAPARSPTCCWSAETRWPTSGCSPIPRPTSR
jgi:MFS family permease